jgi:hypothetical protein
MHFQASRLLALATFVTSAFAQNHLFNILSDDCKAALKNSLHSKLPACAIAARAVSNNPFDNFCHNVDACISEAKEAIQSACVSHLDEKSIKLTLDYGIDIRFRTLCLKDKNNDYCAVTFKNNKQCDDCWPKMMQVVQQVTKKAPAAEKKLVIERREANNPCAESLAESRDMQEDIQEETTNVPADSLAESSDMQEEPTNVLFSIFPISVLISSVLFLYWYLKNVVEVSDI